jgi:hypothetical protein
MAEYRERFVQVTFSGGTPPADDVLKPLFDSALDWLKIAPNAWILWTNKDPIVWLPFIQRVLPTEGSVLIAELNLKSVSENYTGWQSQSIWDWFNKHR